MQEEHASAHHRRWAEREAASEERGHDEKAPTVQEVPVGQAGQAALFLALKGQVEAAVPRWAASGEHDQEYQGVSPSRSERLEVSCQAMTSY